MTFVGNTGLFGNEIGSADSKPARTMSTSCLKKYTFLHSVRGSPSLFRTKQFLKVSRLNSEDVSLSMPRLYQSVSVVPCD